MAMERKQGIKLAWIYALGGTASGIFSTVPSVLLLYYCTAILGMSGLAAATVIFLPKLFALLWDPQVGRLFDRAGKFRGGQASILGMGAGIVAIGFYLVFSPPQIQHQSLNVWMFVSYLILVCGYSMFVVSHLAMPAMIVDDSGIRTTWISIRMLLVSVGILLGASAAPVLTQAFGGGRAGYRIMACILGVTCLCFSLGPLWVLYRQGPARFAIAPTYPLWGPLRNAEFRRLLAAYLLLATATGATSAAAPYWVVQLLGRSAADVGIILGTLIMSNMAFIPLWPRLASRIGKVSALRYCALAYAASLAAIGMLVALRQPWPSIIVAFGALGISFAGLQVLPFALLADFAHRQSRAGATGEGAISGIRAATEKAGLGVGPALIGLLLQLNGQRVDVTFMAWVSILCAVLTIGPALFLHFPSNYGGDVTLSAR